MGDETDLTNAKIATFAGGCFWCMEAVFDETPGVIEAVNGYTGGDVENPTYEQVHTGNTGHYEAVQVFYDPTKITYKELLEIFWRQIDPTDDGGQFADRGSQYRTAIFYHDESQLEEAEESKIQLEESGRFKKPIMTEILPLKEFYEAEHYHQDYYKVCPAKYESYSENSGRKEFIKKSWS